MADANSALNSEYAESAAKASLQRSQTLEGDEIFQADERAQIEMLAADGSDHEKEEHDAEDAAMASASSKSPAPAAAKKMRKEGVKVRVQMAGKLSRRR